ncbi:lysine N(6)-hydroxylase/L-ornithine N(5)-oxygenase family protein [Agrobacterium burrii]|nr:SidA/IucD/PvdA family monooxygenase [Agrobacterium burrii]
MKDTRALFNNPKDQTVQRAARNVVDLLGVGFGPTNLGLAIATEEYNENVPSERKLLTQFIDAKKEFSWHGGMLLPNSTMQISFLKDLVTLRTPTSPYTFVNYLQERDRLSDFINLKTFFPSRREFHDYLCWAAERVSVPVSYGVTAQKIEWQNGCFTVQTERNTTTGAQAEKILARNIVLGLGYRTVLPDQVVPSTRVFHNHNLISNLEKVPYRTGMRFLVVGAGQSAAEIVGYLHAIYGDAEVHASLRRFGYSPSDDTPFVNRIFDPSSVDEFYTAPQELKNRLMNYHWPTNYSAVDADLINDLYRREYEETITGKQRLYIHRTTNVENLDDGIGGVSATISDIGGRYRKQHTFDAIIFATGFQPFDLRQLLGDSIDVSSSFSEHLPIVNRDYSLNLPSVSGRIYLNGGVQHSHGLTSTLLSNVAVRSAEILEAITASTHYDTSEQRPTRLAL